MTPNRVQREAFEHMFKSNNSHVLELKGYLDNLEEQIVNKAMGSIDNENNTSALLGGLSAIKELRKNICL